MKYALTYLFVLFTLVHQSYAQEQDKTQRTFMLTGASFATENNGWFELACETLGVNGINRAKGGTAIANAANQMEEGTLYTKEELDEIDALVIMHVVNQDVFDETDLKKSYTDYKTPFDRSNYAHAFDYVIKRYMTECYNLKFDKTSKYYNTKMGKPPVIVLCTHWHDDREVYNKSVRKLAEKWGIPLIEFDKHIGFTKNTPHPVTGDQISLLYAKDQKKTNGVAYGWHPNRGKQEYIQQRMSAIFANGIRNFMPIN